VYAHVFAIQSIVIPSLKLVLRGEPATCLISVIFPLLSVYHSC
jgi:hypothetical protein